MSLTSCSAYVSAKIKWLKKYTQYDSYFHNNTLKILISLLYLQNASCLKKTVHMLFVVDAGADILIFGSRFLLKLAYMDNQYGTLHCIQGLQ